MGSVTSLVPRPPRKNFGKMLAYGNITYKYKAKFENPPQGHENREFIIMFRVSDDTIQIAETRVHNSGFPGGAFLARMKCKNPDTGKYFAGRLWTRQGDHGQQVRLPHHQGGRAQRRA